MASGVTYVGPSAPDPEIEAATKRWDTHFSGESFVNHVEQSLSHMEAQIKQMQEQIAIQNVAYIDVDKSGPMPAPKPQPKRTIRNFFGNVFRLAMSLSYPKGTREYNDLGRF